MESWANLNNSNKTHLLVRQLLSVNNNNSLNPISSELLLWVSSNSNSLAPHSLGEVSQLRVVSLVSKLNLLVDSLVNNLSKIKDLCLGLQANRPIYHLASNNNLHFSEERNLWELLVVVSLVNNSNLNNHLSLASNRKLKLQVVECLDNSQVSNNHSNSNLCLVNLLVVQLVDLSLDNSLEGNPLVGHSSVNHREVVNRLHHFSVSLKAKLNQLSSVFQDNNNQVKLLQVAHSLELVVKI